LTPTLTPAVATLGSTRWTPVRRWTEKVAQSSELHRRNNIGQELMVIAVTDLLDRILLLLTLLGHRPHSVDPVSPIQFTELLFDGLRVWQAARRGQGSLCGRGPRVGQRARQQGNRVRSSAEQHRGALWDRAHQKALGAYAYLPLVPSQGSRDG